MLEWFLMALGLDYLTSGERQLSSDEEKQAREIKRWLWRFTVIVLLCSLLFFVMLFINH